MRYILLLLLFPCISHGIEIEYNLYTQHYFEDCETASKFANKVADCGRGISNPMIGVKKNKYRILFGKQSAGGPMLGFTYTDSFVVMGAYAQDIKSFEKRGLMPIGIPVNDNLMITPIMGIELDKKYKKAKVFTVIMPILFTVGIGYDY